MTTRSSRVAAVVVYLGTIVAANWITNRYGLVPVGFGQAVTAGTFAAGLSFVARDVLQDAAGRRAVVAVIIAGAALSAIVSPRLALASGVTFVVSETVDMAVYTPLRERRHRLAGWISSNIAGALVDSALFLWLAGFPMSGFLGQSAVKITVGVGTPLLVAAVLAVRKVRRGPVSSDAVGA